MAFLLYKCMEPAGNAGHAQRRGKRIYAARRRDGTESGSSFVPMAGNKNKKFFTRR